MIFGQIKNAFGLGAIKIQEYIKEHEDGIEKVIIIQEVENENNILNKLIDHLGYLGDTKPLTLFVFLLFFISLYFLIKKYPTVLG